MVKMSNKAKEAAKTLAISFQAYFDAIDSHDTNGIKVWGSMLRDAQIKTGIEVHPHDYIVARLTELGCKY